MEVRYRWERNECYMLVDAGEISAGHYQIRMLENNRIDGLLKVQMQRINQQAEFCYTISGRQAMDQKFGSGCVSPEQIRKLMAALNKTARQLEEYLLDIDNLLLNPQFIFWKEEDMPPEFCYYPQEKPEVDFRSSLRKLLQYILNKTNHKDPDSVRIVYGIYQIGMKETFRMQDLMQFLFYDARESPDGQKEATAYSDEKVRKDPYLEEEYQGRETGQREEEKQERKKLKESRQKEENRIETEDSRRKQARFLAVLPAVLGLAAIGRLLYAWYGRRALSDNSGLAIYISAVCSIVIIAGTAAYKLLSSSKAAGGKEVHMWISEAGGGQDDMENKDYRQRAGQTDRDGEQDNMENKGRLFAREQEYRWSTVENQNFPSGWKDEPGQECFPEETCVLGGMPDRVSTGLWLRCLGEGKETEDFFLDCDAGPVTVGKRLKFPDIGLNWPTVSRRHAVFQMCGGVCMVSDCGSTNGTYLDGKRLEQEEQRMVFPGSEIRFADLVFRI